MLRFRVRGLGFRVYRVSGLGSGFLVAVLGSEFPLFLLWKCSFLLSNLGPLALLANPFEFIVLLCGFVCGLRLAACG